MKEPLTAKQRRVFKYICRCIESGWPPTVREIGQEFGIRSPNGVMAHLKALERKGYIKRANSDARAIAVEGMEVMLVTADERRAVLNSRK